MSITISFSEHAIIRMFERGIDADDVLVVIEIGEVVDEYPDDTPYPSKLLVGNSNDRYLHVVIAYNEFGNETIVVTVYEPDPDKWEDGFYRRKT